MKTLDQWKQETTDAYPTVQFTQEDGSGRTYGEVGDWTAHVGPDMQADVVGVYVPREALVERINYVYQGSWVTRFHQHIGHRLDTDARHSHGVAMLCYFLTNGSPSAQLLMAALTHDLAEQEVGDIPFPAKRNLGIREKVNAAEAASLAAAGLTFELTEEEELLLSVADSLDGMLYCAGEAALGNRTLSGIYDAWRNVLKQQCGGLNDTQREVVAAVQQIWESSNAR